jgi:hypothetical protein
MTATGTRDEQGICTFTRDYIDPQTGHTRTTRIVSERTRDSEHHEFWETRDGKDVKTMELDYKRRK